MTFSFRNISRKWLMLLLTVSKVFISHQSSTYPSQNYPQQFIETEIDRKHHTNAISQNDNYVSSTTDERIRKHFHYIFHNKRRTGSMSRRRKKPIFNTDSIKRLFLSLVSLTEPIRDRWQKRHRRLDENAAGDDDANSVDDAYYNTDDDINRNYMKDDNELCSKFLFSFLEGTTDARDTCEGIMNAYTAADCSDSDSENVQDYDDYFNDFTEHQCCQALQQHHSDYCEEDNLLTNFHLFVAAAVLLLCECAKAAVVHYQIHFLPEAAVCILVGTFVGSLVQVIKNLFSNWLPISNIDDLSFDNELFLSLLLPPIIFQAALSVSKYEFKRRRGAIFMFSVFGTVISTFSTGLMVHYMSTWSSAQSFPMLDSLVFGALISSIDPVAILSVLTHLNLDQRDTIFILVFGESLLNDGIAITVFQTLVNRFDGKTTDHTTSADEILEAVAVFMIAMIGSIVVGLACGCGAWVYFNMMGSVLPPVMEVGSFFLWALIPYYISDGVGWSGIVSIVAIGFFMDIYIAPPKHQPTFLDVTSSQSPAPRDPSGYRGMHDEDSVDFQLKSVDSMQTSRSIGPLPSTERINMSETADKHVRFVAHLTSQLAENAIFSYIGLFLFSSNYDWNLTLVSIAVFSCIFCRMLMVIVVSFMMYHIYRCRGISSSGNNSSRTAAAIQNPRTQAVLVLAGLRGAVSLALVENVPIYNSVTGEGCEFKQLMKGMTSACILFTTFVFGGGAYYILPKLGITQDHKPAPNLSAPRCPRSDDKSTESVATPQCSTGCRPII